MLAYLPGASYWIQVHSSSQLKLHACDWSTRSTWFPDSEPKRRKKIDSTNEVKPPEPRPVSDLQPCSA